LSFKGLWEHDPSAMKRHLERVFLCVYVDAFEEERLVFVADANCDREAEFRKAYRDMYGTEFEEVELLQISPVSRVYHKGVEKDYRIQIVEK
jgi:hypothetical protein